MYTKYMEALIRHKAVPNKALQVHELDLHYVGKKDNKRVGGCSHVGHLVLSDGGIAQSKI